MRGKSPTWSACCPGHDDAHPSLAIGLKSNGRITLHCYAGCDIWQILAPLAIELHDLYPDRAYNGARHPYYDSQLGSKRWIDPVIVLRQAERDLYTLAIAATDITANKIPTTGETAARRSAQARIVDAARYARGLRD